MIKFNDMEPREEPELIVSFAKYDKSDAAYFAAVTAGTASENQL